MQKRNKYLLIAIFVLVLAVRLYFSFRSNNFASDETYFTLRYVQDVFNGHIVSFYDSLSFGGRTLLFSPLFYIIFAVLSFGNIILLKFLNELILASLVFIVYLICEQISDSEGAGLLGTTVANFSPIFLIGTTNIIDPYTLSIPLIFLMFYFVMNLENKKFLSIFIVLSFLLPLIHAAAFLYVLAIVVYFLLLAGGALQASKMEKQSLMLSLFIMVLMTLILYKKVLLTYGLSAIWQNLPDQLLISQFTGLDFSSLIVGAGFVPIIFGFWGLYLGFFRQKNKGSYLCGAFMIAILLLLALKFIALNIGLMLLAICMGIMASFSLKKVIIFLDRLNVGKARTGLIVIVVLVIPIFLIFSSALSLSVRQDVNGDVIDDMVYLKSLNVETVAGNLNEGNLITGIARKKNVVDDQFLLAPKPVQRLSDLELLYKAGSIAFAQEIINKYKIDAIYLSNDSKKLYNITTLYYADENPCFEKDGNFYIYKCKKR